MDSIRSICELAQKLGKTERDLEIKCNFCKRLLLVQEKVIFTKYRFRLRWKEGQVYACCRRCMILSSRIEFTGYFENNIQVQDWFASSGFSANAKQIRCKDCLKPLSLREVKRLRGTREFIYLVRGNLRGICTLCRLCYNAQ